MDNNIRIKILDIIEEKSNGIGYIDYKDVPLELQTVFSKQEWGIMMSEIQNIGWQQYKKLALDIIKSEVELQHIQELRTFEKEQLEIQRNMSQSSTEQIKLQDEIVTLTKEQNNLASKQTTISVCNLVVIAILGIFSIIATINTINITENQVRIMDDQKLLMEQSNVPNYAELGIILFQSTLTSYKYPSWDQHQIANREQHNQFDIFFQNRGRFDTGPITDLHFDSKNKQVKELFYPDLLYVGNVSSGQTKRLEVYIWPQNCRANTTTCLLSDAPTGIHEIILRGTCVYCKNQTIEQKFKICIYGEGFKEEKCKI